MNDNVPFTFNGKPVYVVLVAETSDGQLIQFARCM
jgi:hypothetical protein